MMKKKIDFSLVSLDQILFFVFDKIDMKFVSEVPIAC